MNHNFALEKNVSLWQKAFRLEFLLLNLADMNKRHKKVIKKKIGVLSKLLSHEGFSAPLISQHLHKPPTSIVEAAKKETIVGDERDIKSVPPQKRAKNDDDTESDNELNAETNKKQKKPKQVAMKGVEKIKLDTPVVLREQGVPAGFVASQQQLLGQLLSGKQMPGSKSGPA